MRRHAAGPSALSTKPRRPVGAVFSTALHPTSSSSGQVSVGAHKANPVSTPPANGVRFTGYPIVTYGINTISSVVGTACRCSLAHVGATHVSCASCRVVVGAVATSSLRFHLVPDVVRDRHARLKDYVVLLVGVVGPVVVWSRGVRASLV